MVKEELVSEFKSLVSELKLEHLIEDMSDEEINEGLQNMSDKINELSEEKSK